MIREDIADKLNSIIEHHNLNKKLLNDICVSIVMADCLDGSNQKSMSLDKLYAKSGDPVWNEIVNNLGLVTVYDRESESELPDVQKMRLLCDALTIATKGKVEGTHLSSEVSSKIARILEVNINAGSYSDIDECYSVFDLFSTETVNLDWVTELDNKLKVIQTVFEEQVKNVSFASVAKLDDLTVPVKGLKCLRYSDSVKAEGLQDKIYDKLIVNLESYFISNLKRIYKNDAVRANYKLNCVRGLLPNNSFGLKSKSGEIIKEDYRGNFNLMMITKLENLFSPNKEYSISDLDYLAICCIIINKDNVTGVAGMLDKFKEG